MGHRREHRRRRCHGSLTEQYGHNEAVVSGGAPGSSFREVEGDALRPVRAVLKVLSLCVALMQHGTCPCQACTGVAWCDVVWRWRAVAASYLAHCIRAVAAMRCSACRRANGEAC